MTMHTINQKLSKKNHAIDKPTPTRRTTKGLKIGHLNIRSLPNKIDEVRIIMNEHHFDILAISETWLWRYTQRNCAYLSIPSI